MKRIVAVIFLIILLFAALICIGPVEISYADIVAVLFHSGSDEAEANDLTRIIIFESRIPMAMCALLTGAALSAAGLIMQTAFQNPLAGPSVLGVSSGASLGVGLMMLLAGGALQGLTLGGTDISIFLAALIGALAVTMLLSIFSTFLKNGIMLLVVGVMISYLASSIVSLLNYFAPAEGVKSFMVWGLGSLTGVTLSQLPVMSLLTVMGLVGALLLIKPLDALLLGERYAASMGYNVRRLRIAMLGVSGGLTAVATAYCGPIGFVGLIVPQISRILLRTNAHALLMPMSIVLGGAIMMGCALVGVLPADRFGVLPINTITPVIGVPVILYVIIRKDKIFMS